jgi:hypothetical protein
VNGAPAYVLGATLHSAAAPAKPCDGATLTVGACCFVPGAAVDAGPPTGLAGQNPDGGFSSIGASAGTITLVDEASSGKLAALDYGQMPSGFGLAEGYPNANINPEAWNDGDPITASAVGSAEVGAFRVTAPGLTLPSTASPTSIAAAKNLTLSWTPDRNAETMTVTLAPYCHSVSHGTVSCTVPDSASTVTVDARLMQSFQVGDLCWGTLERATERNVELAGGHVTFATQGIDEFIVPVN